MAGIKSLVLPVIGIGVIATAVLAIPSTREMIFGGGGFEGELPPPQMRRLTEAQYRNTISDVFSEDVTVVGRFEPEVRMDGLGAIGASQASISASGYEQYYGIAGSIADQVVSDGNWDTFMPCSPAVSDEFDLQCATQIVAHFGEMLFRRQLSEEDVELWTDAMNASMDQMDTFEEAAGLVIEGMLSSPQFLFIIDRVEEDERGNVQLTNHSMAARLSYFLWNSAPDDELFRAARAGELLTREGLEAQVERMIASPRLSQGTRAFYDDFLDLSRFATLDKDRLIYPAFNQAVAEDAHEQLMMFLDYHLIDNESPYPSIFTAKETFLTRSLGMIYAVPVVPSEGWELVRFPEDDIRGGILSHAGFTALHSHPGRSSATLRGIAVRQSLLCQTVAPAPAAVNFTVVQEVDNPEFRTARARLTQHRTDAACASCHKFIDPIGLSMENFDGAGMYRLREHGELIDTSGEVDGIEYEDLPALENILANHEAATSCVVERLQHYATGRSNTQIDSYWNVVLMRRFERSNYNFRELMATIASSEEFFAVALPQAQDQEDLQQASLNAQERNS